MEPTKTDPVTCARRIVFNRLASELCAPPSSTLPRAATRASAAFTAKSTPDDVMARRAACTERVYRPWNTNVTLMIASIVSSVAVVLWCVAAQ